MIYPRTKWFWIALGFASIISLAMLFTGINNVDAAPVSSCGGYQQCTQVEVGSIVNVISAGNIQAYVAYNDVAHIGDFSGVTIYVSTPGISGTPTMTWTTVSSNGCTVSTSSAQQTIQTTYAMFSFNLRLSLLDHTCTIHFRATLTGGLIVQEIYEQEFRATMTAINDLDNKNRECIASDWNTLCDRTFFENFMGLEGFEAIFIFMAFLLIIMIWNRSEDEGIQIFCFFLILLLGLVWLNLYARTHSTLTLLFGIVTFMTGLYMGVRTAFNIIRNPSRNRMNRGN